MINAQLREQRLSKTLALGVLSPDGISSSAYGTEEILIELMPIFGVAAFAVLIPMTGVILFVMLLVVLSYREVVTVYTRAGGSYVVARENFGPRIAQVAAVALLIDYVVTVAVQVAAGTAAVASTFPAIGPYAKWITIGIILLMCFGNLRGIREAGKIFALPTYLFSGAIILMIVVGLIRAAIGNLPQQNVHQIHGLVHHRPRRLGLDDVRAHLRAAEVVRQRRLVADRHRGGLQRGQRVQAARGRQRPPRPGDGGPDPGHAGGRHLRAGLPDPRRPALGRLPRP